MKPLVIILIILGSILIVLGSGLLVATRIIYKEAFFNERVANPNRSFLKGEQYDKYSKQIKDDSEEALKEKYEELVATSKDGKKLQGYLYRFNPACKKVQIQFHGYKGEGRKSMGGFLKSAKENNINCIIVDHRSHGGSEGHVISFGIKERLDVKVWVEKAIEIFGKDCEVVLRGISMGGATVLMALDTNLQSNVKCVISDCPFSSPSEQLVKTAREGKTKLPPKAAKMMLVLAARIWGHFNLLESSAENAVRNANVPILLFHGTADKFVPFQMSEKIAKANPLVRFIPIEGAGHGLCAYVDSEKYQSEVNRFLKENL